MWNAGQELNFRDFRLVRLSPLANNHDKVNALEVICLPPPDENYWPRSCEEPEKCHSATFSLWHISEAVQWVWIKRLDVAERAITQDEGLRTAEGLHRGHLLSTFFFPGIWSIATDWKRIGRALADKSDGLPSSRLTRGPVKFVPWEWRDLLT